MSDKDNYEHKVEYDNNGLVKSETWYKNGVLHRDDDSPAHIEYINEAIFITMYYQEGKLHRESLEPEGTGYLPSCIKFFHYPDVKMSELWFKNGLHHRESSNDFHLPAQVEYFENGSIHSETYFINGKKNREEGKLDPGSNKSAPGTDKPTHITYNIEGMPYIFDWYKDDIRHREGDKPAHIKLFDNGVVEDEAWYYQGVLHREKVGARHLPAVIYRYEDGTLRCQQWHQYGNYHRELDGTQRHQEGVRGPPSCIYYHDNGVVESEQWYYHGQSYIENNISNLVKYDRDGVKILERWYSPGNVLSRLNGPSEIIYNLDTIYGNRTVNLYYINNAWCPTIKYFTRTYYIKRFVNNIRARQRAKLFQRVKNSRIKSQDVCKLITLFVY
jgi:hypothetical protein